MPLRRILAILPFAAACVSFAEVPPTEPHGTLYIRIVNEREECEYDDGVTLDRRRVTLEGLTKLRVKPGAHQLRFHSLAARYELQDVTAQSRAPYCAGFTCSTIPVSETRTELRPAQDAECIRYLETELRPAQDAECIRYLEVDVPRRAEVLGLFVVKVDGGCSACVSSDLDAGECEPAQTVEIQR
jgi:hypothetical protein